MPMDKDEMWWMAYLVAMMSQDCADTVENRVIDSSSIATASLEEFDKRFPGSMREVQVVPGYKGV
jgi:hypothetical protein